MNARAMISGESVQHWSSSQILPKIAHDVVEKCIKIFVKTSLEIPLAQNAQLFGANGQDNAHYSFPISRLGESANSCCGSHSAWPYLGYVRWRYQAGWFFMSEKIDPTIRPRCI